jgi:hypothetical protein
MKHYLVLGQWNAICDMCGLEYKSSKLRKNWRGTMVCARCYETRNPQDFIRVRGERPAPPWTRPEAPPVFIDICYLWGISGYANLAVAECMVAENDTYPADFLSNLEQGTG